jgi:glycosyltransferase involved in cell wall biosynthesis
MVAKPKISVVVYVLNAEKYLAGTLETVFSQTYQDWEIVIMDGASKDATLQIAQQFADEDSRINIFSEPDESPYQAAIRGFQRARGDYILLLPASDGYLDNQWLEMCAGAFDRDPQISLVWGISLPMTEDGRIIPEPPFAYAHFLKEPVGGSPFFAELKKRISNPKSFLKLFKKFNKSKFTIARESFKKQQDPPQKQDWFWYWLRTGTIFPDGNMCISKRVLEECFAPYNLGTHEAGNWAKFYFDFNAKGYLAYCFPIPVSFGRKHGGSVTERAVQYDEKNNEVYADNMVALRKKLAANPNAMVFRDRAGNPIPSESHSL